VKMSDVVPAEPGYFVLEFDMIEETDPYYFRMPVIAWKILPSGKVRPITPRGGVNTDEMCCDVLWPSGEVYDYAFDRIYESIKQWYIHIHALTDDVMQVNKMFQKAEHVKQKEKNKVSTRNGYVGTFR
jgi:hypothetical protein